MSNNDLSSKLKTLQDRLDKENSDIPLQFGSRRPTNCKHFPFITRKMFSIKFLFFLVRLFLLLLSLSLSIYFNQIQLIRHIHAS